MIHWMVQWAVLSLLAADARVELVAGGGSGTDGAPALQSNVDMPFACEFDAVCALWFVEFAVHRLRVVDSTGKVWTKAGTGRKGWGGDGGPGHAAEFNGLHNLAIGPDGAVYLSDTFNNRIRKYDPKSGNVSTFAGTGRRGYSGDGGPAIKADFAEPHCVAFDIARRNLYVADLANRRIRVLDVAAGTVDHVAGSGFKGVPTDGRRAKTQPLVDPRAVAVDAKGAVFVVERSGHALRRIDPDGTIRTVAGIGRKGAVVADGPALAATLNGPKHACIDPAGDVLIADTENHAIRKLVVSTGQLVRVAGTGVKGAAGVGGSALDVQLKQPHGVAIAKNGSIYIADSGNNRILRVVP